MRRQKKTKPRAMVKVNKRKWLKVPKVDWSQTRRVLTGMAWSAAGLGLVAAWIVGVPRLEQYAAAHQPPGTIEASFVNPPSWLDPDLETSLATLAAEHVGPDPRARADLIDVRETLLATGWFTDIVQVRRVSTYVVEVDARFAHPAALIRDVAGRTDHVVDPRGQLLPRAYPAGTGPVGAAVIVGARYDRPPRPGEQWPGDDVTAALEVLHLVGDRPWAGQVARIDVSGHWRDGTVRLVTDRGCSILWGRAPGDDPAGEVPAEQKLSYLDYHYEQYGHIDRGLSELDITGDVVVGK